MLVDLRVSKLREATRVCKGVDVPVHYYKVSIGSPAYAQCDHEDPEALCYNIFEDDFKFSDMMGLITHLMLLNKSFNHPEYDDDPPEDDSDGYDPEDDCPLPWDLGL